MSLYISLKEQRTRKKREMGWHATSSLSREVYGKSTETLWKVYGNLTRSLLKNRRQARGERWDGTSPLFSHTLYLFLYGGKGCLSRNLSQRTDDNKEMSLYISLSKNRRQERIKNPWLMHPSGVLTFNLSWVSVCVCVCLCVCACLCLSLCLCWGKVRVAWGS